MSEHQTRNINNPLSGQTVLVTGAGGFIGSHLTEALVRQGCKVRAMIKYNSRNDWGNLEQLDSSMRSQIEILAGDVTDPYFVDKAVEGCTTVFHLAALIGIPYSYIAQQHYVHLIVQCTLNVLEACRRYPVPKIINTYTS